MSTLNAIESLPIPVDIVFFEIASRLDESTIFNFSWTSRFFRSEIPQRTKTFPSMNRMLLGAAEKGNVEVIKFWGAKRFSAIEDLCHVAAQFGNISILIALKGEDHVFDQATIASAAFGKQKETLLWLARKQSRSTNHIFPFEVARCVNFEQILGCFNVAEGPGPTKGSGPLRVVTDKYSLSTYVITTMLSHHFVWNIVTHHILRGIYVDSKDVYRYLVQQLLDGMKYAEAYRLLESPRFHALRLSKRELPFLKFPDTNTHLSSSQVSLIKKLLLPRSGFRVHWSASDTFNAVLRGEWEIVRSLLVGNMMDYHQSLPTNDFDESEIRNRANSHEIFNLGRKLNDSKFLLWVFSLPDSYEIQQIATSFITQTPKFLLTMARIFAGVSSVDDRFDLLVSLHKNCKIREIVGVVTFQPENILALEKFSKFNMAKPFRADYISAMLKLEGRKSYSVREAMDTFALTLESDKDAKQLLEIIQQFPRLYQECYFDAMAKVASSETYHALLNFLVAHRTMPLDEISRYSFEHGEKI